MVSQLSVGQRYRDFITDAAGAQTPEQLFAPAIKKVVNSKVVCHNRDELIQQMNDVHEGDGVTHIEVLDLVTGKSRNADILRFEVTFKDNSVFSVITILTANAAGKIEEINEVFGEKHGYDWRPKV